MECLHITLLLENGHISEVIKLYESSEPNSEVRKYMDTRDFSFNAMCRYISSDRFKYIIDAIDTSEKKTILDFANEGRWERVYSLVTEMLKNREIDEKMILDVILLSCCNDTYYNTLIEICTYYRFSSELLYTRACLELTKKGKSVSLRGSYSVKILRECLEEIDSIGLLMTYRIYFKDCNNSTEPFLKRIESLLDLTTIEGRKVFERCNIYKHYTYEEEITEPYIKVILASTNMDEYDEAIMNMIVKYIPISKLSYNSCVRLTKKKEELMKTYKF